MSHVGLVLCEYADSEDRESRYVAVWNPVKQAVEQFRVAAPRWSAIKHEQIDAVVDAPIDVMTRARNVVRDGVLEGIRTYCEKLQAEFDRQVGKPEPYKPVRYDHVRVIRETNEARTWGTLGKIGMVAWLGTSAFRTSETRIGLTFTKEQAPVQIIKHGKPITFQGYKDLTYYPLTCVEPVEAKKIPKRYGFAYYDAVRARWRHLPFALQLEIYRWRKLCSIASIAQRVEAAVKAARIGWILDDGSSYCAVCCDADDNHDFQYDTLYRRVFDIERQDMIDNAEGKIPVCGSCNEPLFPVDREAERRLCTVVQKEPVNG
jgi:hypothetical protein